MKKLTITLLAIAAVAAPAQIKQTWTNSVIDANLTAQVLQTAVSTTGNTFTLAQMQDGTGRINCYDGLGVIQWTATLPSITNSDGARLLVDAEGNLTVAYSRTSSNCWLTRFEGATGASLWSKQVPGVMRTVDAAMDGQENIVILAHAALLTGGYGPTIRKFSSNGALTMSYSSDMASYDSTSLAVAANGQIYFAGWKANAAGAEEKVTAITPNGTLRYATGWINSGGAYIKPLLAADRNGRVAAVDVKLSNIKVLQVHSFDATGVDTIAENAFAGNLVSYLPKFDANGMLVVASSRQGTNGIGATVSYFDMTDPYAELINEAELFGTGGTSYLLTDLVTDAFGQAYVSASENISAKNVGQVYAFDVNHAQPLWSFKQNFSPTANNLFRVAVGRWGQVALGSTIGSTTYEGASGIKQLGLRNLLINGQSFTGGRTITGTVNFYSNDTMDRTVTLTSSSAAYAPIASSATVPVGGSQVGMSIALKPTAVRRAVRIDGVHNGIKRSVVFYIEPPVASGLTVYPTTIQGGKNVNATARINGAAPTNGMVVNLSSNEPSAVIPSSVTIAEGALTKGFVITTTTVASTKTATITAATGATVKTATLTITP